jgi:NAD(P)-dependent dehydrogenase (short-subunit alcohol dehydrogenase family)
LNSAVNLDSFQNSLRILISAGASGIGRKMADMFIQTGSKVYICDISEEGINKFLIDHPQSYAKLTDISDYGQVEELIEDVKNQLGGLDVVINNAGIAGPTAALEDIDPEEWNKTINVNLNGTFYLSKLAAPLLVKSATPSIINIASSAVFSGYPNRSPYSASKWAILGLTKTWAMELGPKGIRVNAICPGSVNGPRIDQVIQRDAQKKRMTPEALKDVYLRQTSLRTFIDAEDIAYKALFLCSPFGTKISGQIIGVDGHTESLSNWLD